MGGGSETGAQIGSGALGPRQLRSRAPRAAGPPQPGRPAMSAGPAPRAARTPFSIADILGPGIADIPRGPSAPQPAEPSPGPRSPLCALEELTSNAFRGRDGLALQPSEGRAAPGAPGHGPAGRRRRKSRTAFTAQQVLELERRFGFQRYLAPPERDGLAARLGLDNAQVVTWFQNRRAKLRRDVEEMRADVASLRAWNPEVQGRLALPARARGLGLGSGPARPESGPCLSDEEIQVDD